MRIAIWSTIQAEKEAFIKNFLETWPKYKHIESFGKITEAITKEQVKTQLDLTMDNIMERTKKDDVIYSECTLDLLCQAFWDVAKATYPISEVGKSTKEQDDDLLMQKLFQLVRQSMHFYDIILYIPCTKEKVPETEHEAEINNFMNAVHESYTAQKDWVFPFKDVNGTPAVIELTGTAEENSTMVKLYLNPEGREYSKDDSLVSAILS